MSQTKKVAIGLKALYMGAVGASGGLGTSLTAVLYTKATTPVLTSADGTTTDFEIEESDTPYYSTTTPGKDTLTFSLYGLDVDQLLRFFGGTKTTGSGTGETGQPDTWEAPISQDPKEYSIVLNHKQGGHLEIPRANVTVKKLWNFQKSALPELQFTCDVLIPTDGTTKPYKFSQADYAP